VRRTAAETAHDDPERKQFLSFLRGSSVSDGVDDLLVRDPGVDRRGRRNLAAVRLASTVQVPFGERPVPRQSPVEFLQVNWE